MDIKKHSPGSVAIIGNMNFPFSKIPYQPGINISKEQITFFGLFTGAGDIFQNPANLGTREISIYYETCFLFDCLIKPFCFEAVTVLSGTPALPDYSVIHRLAGGFIPYYRGFPLVGNPDGRYISRGNTRPGLYFGQNPQLGRPNFHRIMLNPTRFWENLGKFLLSRLDNVTLLVEDNRAGTCCSLVNRD